MRDVAGFRGDGHAAPAHRAAVGFVGDSIAFERGRSEFTQTIPSRDRARRSQPCLAMPSAADIQRKLIATEEDKVNRRRHDQGW